MKKVFIAIFCLATFNSFSQQEELTKIKFKVIADCGCTVQLARNDKPAGQILTMTADSFMIAIEKETTGFFISCGNNTVYMKIPYTPGEGFYRLLCKMPCEGKSFEIKTIEPDNNTFFQ